MQELKGYVYDDGERLLGNVKDVKKYMVENCEEYEEVEEVIKELCYFDDNTMVVVDYKNGMGFVIDKWTEKDRNEVL